MRSVFSDEGYVKSSENNTSLSSYLAEWIYVLCHLVGFSDLLQGQFNCSFMVIKRINVLFSRRERVIQKGDFSFLSSFFFLFSFLLFCSSSNANDTATMKWDREWFTSEKRYLETLNLKDLSKSMIFTRVG